MKVAVAWQASEQEQALIRQTLPEDCELVVAAQNDEFTRYEAEPQEVTRICREADAVIAWVLPRAAVAEARRLRYVSWMHAGCDKLDFELLRTKGIKVANVRGANDAAVAEQALAFMLALTKRLLQNNRAVVEAHWQPLWDPNFVSGELAGATVVIVGLGALGKQIARRAHAFGMYVIGIRKHPAPDPDLADEVLGASNLPSAVRRANFVVLSVPLTRETDGFFGYDLLRSMRRDAFLINIARGGIVDERALYKALTNDWIAGFASDVWWDYPDAMPPSMHFGVPSRLGIHRLPNVIGSGDRAANTFGVRDRMIRMGAENIAAFARGLLPVHVVDLELGY
jgi:phosphoglycerate dehydrogenase-like enzyme